MEGTNPHQPKEEAKVASGGHHEVPEDPFEAVETVFKEVPPDFYKRPKDQREFLLQIIARCK